MKDFRHGYGLKLTEDAKKSGFISIEVARKQYREECDYGNTYDRIERKAWINYCESRNKNGNLPMNLDDYSFTMRTCDLHDQIVYDVIDISDLGTKDEMIKYLLNYNF